MPLATRHLRLIARSETFGAELAQAEPSDQERAHLESLLRQLDAVMQHVNASTDESAP